jgi:hypothetical protein
MLHSQKKGNALVDLIIAMIILGLVSISVVGAYTSLMSMASNAFRNSQASWFGNSVMEIYSAKAFGDIIADNNFTLDDQFPGYTANIAVAYKDVNLLESEITDGNINSNYKEITAVISGQGVDDILTYTTLRSDCNEEGPYITGISTELSNDFFSSTDGDGNVPIKVNFNRNIDIANANDINLALNVSQRINSIEDYSVSQPDPAISVNTPTLDGDRRYLLFNYDVGSDHTSSALNNYLNVSNFTLSGSAKITGYNGASSDGCAAVIDLPTRNLAADSVIIRIASAQYYVFQHWKDNGTNRKNLQDAINPVVEGSGLTAPSFGDIFDQWKRFDGNTKFDNKAAAVLANNTNATSWIAQYSASDPPPNDYSATMGGEYDTFDHFYMELNVTPANGFVSPQEYESFILEVTLYSSAQPVVGWKDNDMIGIIIAYEESGNLCNQVYNSHVGGVDCSTSGSNPYVLFAGRTVKGSEPREGWGLVYSKASSISYSSHTNEATNEGGGTGTGERWNIEEESPPNQRSSSSSWDGHYTRIKVQRAGNIITIWTTDFYASRAEALAAGNLGVRNDGTGYFDGEDVLTVNLEHDRRLHKFIGGSPFGYITFSQPGAKFLDNSIPEPEVGEQAHADYVVYFDDRGGEDQGVYDTWNDFDLVAGDCCQPDVSNPRSYNPSGSGIWKWNAPAGDYRFVPGLTIQDLNGYYGIVKPIADGQSDPVEENGDVIRYFIKKVAENQ